MHNVGSKRLSFLASCSLFLLLLLCCPPFFPSFRLLPFYVPPLLLQCLVQHHRLRWRVWCASREETGDAQTGTGPAVVSRCAYSRVHASTPHKSTFVCTALCVNQLLSEWIHATRILYIEKLESIHRRSMAAVRYARTYKANSQLGTFCYQGQTDGA